MLEKKMSASEVGLRPGLEESEDLRESETWVSSPEAMPEMTENETPTKHRHRKKNREIHNAVERHRKKKINSGINRIGELIPCSPALKQSKNMILDQALKYIAELKRQNDELLLNGGEKEQEAFSNFPIKNEEIYYCNEAEVENGFSTDEIIRLRKQLFDTQKENGRYIDLLKSHDICLYDDPTIHWRGNLKNAKVPLTVPTNEVQKNIIVYSNGSPLGVNNQGVSFNVSQNLPKQTANVVPVQRTCNLLTPATIASVHTTENKTSVGATISASISHQQIPLCLPVTIPAQAILKISTAEGEPSILHSASTNVQDVFQSGMISQLQQVSCSVQPSNPVVVESTTRQQHIGLTEKVLTQAVSVPLTVSLLAQEAPSTCISCSGFQENSVVTVTRTAASGNFPSVSNNPIVGVLKSDNSLVTTTTSDTIVISTLPSTTANTLSCLDTSWTRASSLAFSGVTSDPTKVCNRTRNSTAGNTQTTWTTLQVAGNTIQPLSHTSHNAVPILVSEQANCTGLMPVTSGIQTINGISLNNLPGEGQPIEPVTLPQCQHLSVQPLVSQTQLKNQPAKNIVPLNAAMQVIQMTSPIGSGVSPVPANQNVIILQPPNSVPCPPVMRAEVPTPAVGQQIVIIQAAPNPNPLPLLSAQPPGPSRMPIQAINPVCTNSAVQNTNPPQIFGGKHLVHILPRPTSSTSGPGSSQSVSVSMFDQQQPATISLNGQLFALQPMMSSSSASNQTPMQFIQPTSSEDPNTNVALNTFGALASLSQSLSQIAGPSCVQLSVSRPNILPTAASSQITTTNCISLSTTATSPIKSEQLTALQSTSIAAKPFASLTSYAKSKKTCKKSSAKKRLVSNKEVPQVTKAEDALMLGPPNTEVSESLISMGEEAQVERTSLASQSVSVCQASSVVSVNDLSHSNPVSNEGNASQNSLGLHPEGKPDKSTVQSPLLAKTVGEQQLDLTTAVCKDPIPIAEEAAKPQHPIPLALDPHGRLADGVTCSVSSECSKQSVTMSCSTSASTVEDFSSAHVSEPPKDHATPNIGGVSEMGSTSESSVSRPDSSSILQVASDLLEGQGLGGMLLQIAKEKTSAIKTTSFVQNELSHISAPSSKLEDSSDVGSPDRRMAAEVECVRPDHADVSEHDVGVTSSSVSSRQSDSPMSVSSGSNRNFSVASMLPDIARDEVTNNTPLVPALNVSTSCTHTDIVALAARTIIEQGKCEKEKRSIQVDESSGSCKATKDATLHSNGHHLLIQTCKEKGREQYEAPIVKNNSHAFSEQTNSSGPVEKPSCSVSINAPIVSSQISTCQSQSGVSLSINNLIQSGSATYPFLSCSSVSQPSEQIAITTTANLPKPSVSYDIQLPAPTLTSEFSQEQHHAIRATTIQASQVQEAEQKQNRETRKESVKRTLQEDHLLSTAKRQKQCESTSVQHDRIASMRGNSEDFVEQTQMLADLVPHNSSNSVVPVSSHLPANSFNTLFSTNVTFVNTDLRQTEIRCNSQPLLSEQQGQGHNPHLQQRVSSQSNNHLHNNNPYLKQQQVGQLREHHHLYQQHLVSHAEGSIHSQPHNVHQQRTVTQDVQMQKKRNLVQGGQANPLSLQQKHHGSDPGRQKGSQTHPHHHQQVQQQIQRHFSAPQSEKSCDNPAVSRSLHSSHPQNHLNPDILHQQQQDVGSRQQASSSSSEHASAHNQLQRLMNSRTMEQHMVSQPSIVSRQSNMTCAPHRQERNRVSSYSAEALIGKASNSVQRMAISIQGPRVPDQLEMRTYLDVSRNKSLPIHNIQSRISVDHAVNVDVQRLSDCQSYKPSGSNQQPAVTFDIQTSRNGEMGNTVSSLRSMQPQTFRIGQNSGVTLDRQKRLPYAPVQGIHIGGAVPPREMENTCPQSFIQSLLGPHLGEPVVGSQRLISEHQRNTHCGVATPLEYGCPTGREPVHLRRDNESQNRESCDMSMGVINSRNNSLSIPFSSSSSSGEVQGRNTSPHISAQKSNPMRMTESQSSKSHLISNATSNVHGINRTSHPAISHGNADQGQTSVRQSNPTAAHRSRNPLQDSGSSKVRQTERTRSSNPRHGNVFDPSLPHLPLSTGSSMILGRQSSAAEKRPSIVRFMSDGSQVPNDNTTPDQHALSQNFGFPFIPDGGMNPALNPNTAFIPPVTQSATTRTPALIPVDPQNTLPSFYPPYSPAHPSLSNDLSIPYFSNQMFTNPGTEKPNSASLNNRFGSILSPPRPVGFAQPSFPLLPDMPPMHMANPSHLSNFNLTSLFPEIATALPPDASAMSPLLSIVNSATSDSSKQSSNRPAHNISHILGHDCSSAV